MTVQEVVARYLIDRHGYDTMSRSETLEEAARICALFEGAGGLRITGRDIHREWRDGMLEQGRYVEQLRMEWETLTEQDRELDDRIAKALHLATPAPAPAALVQQVAQMIAEDQAPESQSFIPTIADVDRAKGLAGRVCALFEGAGGKRGKPEKEEGDE